MRKILCLLMAVILLCVGLCGCNKDGKRQERIDEHLQAGEYQQAYDVAETSNEKDAIIAENFLAFVCYDLATNVDTELTLVSGYFGQAKAKATDAYAPNDSVSTIDNYEELAEYVSLMTGENVPDDYYYGVLEVETEGYISYCLAYVNVDSKVVEFPYAWSSLEQTAQDSNVVALYKYLARYVVENETELGSEAVYRINEKYLADSPEKVKFEFDLD